MVGIAASVALTLCSALLATARAQEPAPVTEAARALEAVLERRDFQTDLPDREWPEGSRSRAAPSNAAQARRARPAQPQSRSPGFSFPATGPLLFWLLVGGAAVALVLWLARAWQRSHGDLALPTGTRSETGGARTRAEDAATRAAPARDDALRAAAEGRYLDAIHTLLLGALARTAGKPVAALADASTSRERLAETPSPSVAHDALEVLVASVERGLFGGRPAGRDDFERCLESYDRLEEQGSP